MIINSIVFFLFFLFFLSFYFSYNSCVLQNLWILIASYVFYGWTDWRLVGLLLVTTVVFFILGIKLSSTHSKKSKIRLMYFGVILGIGLLLYFKYMNFFIEQFAFTFGLLGIHTNWSSFNIVVPIGISFFTFKGCSKN